MPPPRKDPTGGGTCDPGRAGADRSDGIGAAACNQAEGRRRERPGCGRGPGGANRVVQPRRGAPSQVAPAISGLTWRRIMMAIAIAFLAALMIPGSGSQQRASPGPVLGVANPTAIADADSMPAVTTPSGPHSEAGRPIRPQRATLPPTGATGPGRLETTAERLSVWEDKFGEVRVQVIVTARNAGAAPLVVATSSASWSVSDEAGDDHRPRALCACIPGRRSAWRRGVLHRRSQRSIRPTDRTRKARRPDPQRADGRRWNDRPARDERGDVDGRGRR